MTTSATTLPTLCTNAFQSGGVLENTRLGGCAGKYPGGVLLSGQLGITGGISFRRLPLQSFLIFVILNSSDAVDEMFKILSPILNAHFAALVNKNMDIDIYVAKFTSMMHIWFRKVLKSDLGGSYDVWSLWRHRLENWFC